MDISTRLFYRLGCGLLGIAVLVMIAVVVEPTVGLSRSQTMYERLQTAAAKGDEWAISKLAEADAMQQAQGQSGPPQEREVGSRDTVNDISVTVEGREPFYLKIDNLPVLTSIGDIDEYVARRQTTLAQLANQDSGRQVEVSISPHVHMPLAQMWKLRDAYRLDIDQMLVDLFVDGKWHSVMFVGDPNDPGEAPYIDFTASTDEFEAQIKRLIPPRTPDSLALDVSKLELRISWARAKMQATDALKFNSDPAIMLADPITDILDAYQGRAIEVRVQNVPHLLVEKTRLESKSGQDSAPVSPPGVAQPTPAPERR